MDAVAAILSGVSSVSLSPHNMTQAAPPQDAVSVIFEEFPADTPCALSVDVPGAVTLLRPGSENDQAEVEISVTGCSASKAETILDRLQIGADLKKGTLRVFSDADRSTAKWWRWIRTLDVTIHIDLRLPRHVDVDLTVAAGEIDIANLEGHFDLDIMGGACHLQSLNGTLDLRGESCAVRIEEFSGDDLTARVAVGSLDLEEVDVDTMTIRSVSAPLSLHTVEGDTTVTGNSTSVDITDLTGPCTVRNQGGPLTYRGTPTADTELTVVGDVLDVQLPADHPADLRLFGPTLSLDDTFSFDGEWADESIEGLLNDGGAALTLRAVGGTVRCAASE